MRKSGNQKSGKTEKSKESETIQSVKSADETLHESLITPISKSTDDPSTSRLPESGGSVTFATTEYTLGGISVPSVDELPAPLTENPAGTASLIPSERPVEMVRAPEPSPATKPGTVPTAPVIVSAIPAKSSVMASGSHCATSEPCYVSFAPDAPQCRACRYHKRDKK